MVRAENPAIRSDSTRPDIRAHCHGAGSEPRKWRSHSGHLCAWRFPRSGAVCSGQPSLRAPFRRGWTPAFGCNGPRKQLTLAVRRCRGISLRGGRRSRASQRVARGRARLTRRAARARVRRPPLTRSSRPLRSHRRCRRRGPPEADKGRRSALRPRACAAPDRVSARIREVSPSNCIWTSPMRVLFCSSMPLTRVPVLCSACGPVWSNREG